MICTYNGLNAYLQGMLLSELAEVVGPAHVLHTEADRLGYVVDIMWLPQM